MSEEMTTTDPGEMSRELPAWTPFERTGQIVTSNLPNTPDGVVWENSRYVVIVRDCGGGGEGKLIWLSIKNADNSARMIGGTSTDQERAGGNGRGGGGTLSC